MTGYPKTILWACCAVLAMFVLAVATAPAYTFHPFCTYDEIYRLSGTIEVGGETYASEAVRQTTKSRPWIQNLNGAGCLATHGTALAFRLRDNRVVLLRTMVCRAGRNVLEKANRIDVAAYCHAVHRNLPNRPVRLEDADGYIVDNADAPSVWSKITLGTPAADNTVVRLTSIVAETVRAEPRDDLDRNAPGLLRADYRYLEWFNSPGEIVPYKRRAEYREGKTFARIVEERQQ